MLLVHPFSPLPLPEPVMEVRFEIMDTRGTVKDKEAETERRAKPLQVPKKTENNSRQPEGHHVIKTKSYENLQTASGPGYEKNNDGLKAGSEVAHEEAGADGNNDRQGLLTERNDQLVDAASLLVIKKVIPDYPAFSRKRKEEGTVKIIVTIENGKVVKTEIEESSGFERLDASAVRAVKQWRFDNNGIVRARVPFIFKLAK